MPPELELDLTRSIEENAGHYFELSKKAKKKLKGAEAALEESRKKLRELQQQEEKFLEVEQQKQQLREQKSSRQKEWYEKFHWFISSEGFLCFGGKDATSNEVVIKKHLEKDDVVFHTDMAGSPFFIVQNGQNAAAATLQEAAQATAIYSKAWKLGHTTADVFCINPEQVSKEAQAGEYISKGSFMIYGKKQYFRPQLECAIGLKDGRIIGGPVAAITAQTSQYIIIVVGDEKKSSLAKKIKARLKGGELDDIIKFLPAGEGKIKK